MIENVLAYVVASGTEMDFDTKVTLEALGYLGVLCIPIFIFILIIYCLIRVVRFFRSVGKEQKLTRMELGKLAEELRLIREERKEKNPS
jgi:hypothetical protein